MNMKFFDPEEDLMADVASTKIENKMTLA